MIHLKLFHFKIQHENINGHTENKNAGKVSRPDQEFEIEVGKIENAREIEHSVQEIIQNSTPLLPSPDDEFVNKRAYVIGKLVNKLVFLIKLGMDICN